MRVCLSLLHVSMHQYAQPAIILSFSPSLLLPLSFLSIISQCHLVSSCGRIVPPGAQTKYAAGRGSCESPRRCSHCQQHHAFQHLPTRYAQLGFGGRFCISKSLRWESPGVCVNGTCEARRASSRCLDGGMVRAFVAHSSVGLTSSCTVCWHRC